MAQAFSAARFDDVSHLFVELQTNEHPSAVHGYLSGLVAGGAVLEGPLAYRILAQILGKEELANVRMQDIEQFMSAITKGLVEADLSYEPLLPSDDESMVKRMKALSVWSSHFISGFGISVTEQSLTSETREFLQDLERIASIDVAELEETGEDEEDILIVADHLKMIALQLSMETRQSSDETAKASPNKKH